MAKLITGIFMVVALVSCSSRSFEKAADTTASKEIDEERIWLQVKDKNQIGYYRAFIKKYPASLFIADARTAIRSLEIAEGRTWRSAKSENKIQSSAEERAWRSAKSRNKIQSYSVFIEQYPTSSFVADAKIASGNIVIEKACDSNDYPLIAYHPSPEGTPQSIAKRVYFDLQKKARTIKKDEIFLNEFNASYDRFPKVCLTDTSFSLLDEVFLERAQSSDTKFLMRHYSEFHNEERLAIQEHRWYWTAKLTKDPVGLEVYLRTFPKGLHGTEALSTLEHLLFEQARSANSAETYNEYLSRFPNGIHRTEALTSLERLMFEAAYSANGRLQNCREYLSRFPNGSHVTEVRVIYEGLLFEQVKASVHMDALDEYLQLFPTGKHINRVKKIRRKITKNERQRALQGESHMVLYGQINTKTFSVVATPRNSMGVLFLESGAIAASREETHYYLLISKATDQYNQEITSLKGKNVHLAGANLAGENLPRADKSSEIFKDTLMFEFFLFGSLREGSEGSMVTIEASLTNSKRKRKTNKTKTKKQRTDHHNELPLGVDLLGPSANPQSDPLSGLDL